MGGGAGAANGLLSLVEPRQMGGHMEGAEAAVELKRRRGRKWGLGCLVALLAGAAAAAVGYAHLQEVYQTERLCPPVSGVVVDRDTGLPVPGAFVSRQMMGTSKNLFSGLAGGSPAEPLLRFAQRTTGEQGRFSFPADKAVLVGGFWEHLLGPDTREGIRLVVYARDYLPARSEALGFGWTTEEWKGIDWSNGPNKWHVIGPVDFSATRQGNLETGYAYRIALIQAVTEAQWKRKCHETWLLNSLYIPKSISDEWLFSDLCSYLERWPKGEKAGEYIIQLDDLAMAGGGRICTGDVQAIANLTPAEVRSTLGRMERVLALMDSLPGPSVQKNPVQARNWPSDRNELRSCIENIKEALEKRGHTTNAR